MVSDTGRPLDAVFASIFDRVGAIFPLREVELNPELAHPKSFLKILDADHHNWEADRFRKLFGMRFRVKLPPLDQLNCIFYPEPVYDTPIFLFFALVTKRKLIGHLNVYCPFDDEEYLAKHIDPLLAALKKYPPFDCADRYPVARRIRGEPGCVEPGGEASAEREGHTSLASASSPHTEAPSHTANSDAARH